MCRKFRFGNEKKSKEKKKEKKGKENRRPSAGHWNTLRSEAEVSFPVRGDKD